MIPRLSRIGILKENVLERAEGVNGGLDEGVSDKQSVDEASETTPSPRTSVVRSS